MEILNKISANLKTLLPKNKRSSLLLAFSGGIDSRCLLDILVKLREELGFDLYVAYVNHNLRGEESLDEEKFVRNTVKKLGLKLFTHTVENKTWSELKRESVEMAARRIRYGFFHKTADENKIDLIVTAHNRDDNIETFFLKILRAGGIDTLKSIPKKNLNIIRPMLDVTRKEIEHYAAQNRLEFIEDSSNKENKYRRNILRNKVIPNLSEVQPGFENNIEKLFAFFEEETRFINRMIRKYLKKVTVYSTDKYFALSKQDFICFSPFIKKQIIKIILNLTGFPAKPDKYLFKSILFSEIISYKKSDFLCLERGNLLWFINTGRLKGIGFDLDVPGIPYNIGKDGFEIFIDKTDTAVPGNGFCFNGSIVNYPLHIRTLKENDTIMTTEKIKITKILKNMKIPGVLFKEVIVIADNDNPVGFYLDGITRISKDFYFDRDSEILSFKIHR